MTATEQRAFSFISTPISLSNTPVDSLPVGNGRRVPANVMAACAEEWFAKLRANEPLYIDACHRQLCNACGYRVTVNSTKNLLKRFGILDKAVYEPRQARKKRKLPVTHDAVTTPFGKRSRKAHNTPIALRADLDNLKRENANLKEAITAITAMLSNIEKEINQLVEKKVYEVLEAADRRNG